MENAAVLEQNVGPVDRTVRLILAVALIVLPAVLGWTPWTVAVLAAVGGSQAFAGLSGY